MKILFLCVGKTTDKRLDALITEYVGRIVHYVPFELHCLPEVKATKSLPPETQKQREAESLMSYLRPGDHIVLLDERGREPRSIELASWLERLQNRGIRRLVFIVGGPYGFAPTLYAAANEQLSLSRLTFSHQMVRLFFTEQLYRALTILRGEPYHHE